MSSSVVSARRLAAATLAAAAVVGAVALPASAAGFPRAERPKVEISAVQYDAPGRDDRSNRSLNKEWVELTNTTRHAINLDGWTLANRRGDTYTFGDYRLAARATVRVHTGEGRDSSTDLFQDRSREVWDNRADTATLRNDRSRFVDDESWGGRRHGWDRHHGDYRHDRGDYRHDRGDYRHDRGDYRHDRGEHRHDRGEHRHDRGDRH